jgi:hypothetical protein
MSGWASRAPSWSGLPIESEARLVPILTRVIELGRGVPGLVRWVQGRLGESAPMATGPEARRLARELAGVLRRIGTEETRADPVGAWQTLTLPAPAGHPGTGEMDAADR